MTFTSYGSINTFLAVAEIVDKAEQKHALDVHTVTLILNGQHGGFDVTVLADTEDLEPVKITARAPITGGVSDVQW